jgi:energy-coupling factor transporter ATP-binding protein EcfA2
MKLIGFRVTNFRSVEDSGWIETDDVTALIGTNESGKTNLLVPLWKLRPAKGGELNPIADYPRKRYNEIRAAEEKPTFIEAHFRLSDELAAEVAGLATAKVDDVRIASVTRNLGGGYTVGFPKARPVRACDGTGVTQLLTTARTDMEAMSTATKTDEALKSQVLAAIDTASAQLGTTSAQVGKQTLDSIRGTLAAVDTSGSSKRSTIAPRLGQLTDDIDELAATVSRPHPSSVKAARQAVLNNLPSFVYYSNYGNLDSEIYLPHVIEDLKRDDLGSHAEAKARTLRVLFEFVKLDPQEILELGRDFPQSDGRPTEEQIREIAEKKKEREILLQSASVDLTGSFRDWWKQGDYRFRFQADGAHFRIWVSDDRRPEEVELEGRSTGLQWFLSFYLIFLVESRAAHKGCVLLLDEAGLSLHPVAQKDLIRFFDGLADTNQLLYTTHSPFLVDPDHLDRVRAVYVNDKGTTEASPDLRASEANPAQSKSIYAVFAALGLTVSESILQGCQPVVVEGTADQIYLSGIKNYLIGRGMIAPKRELVFIPAGGVRGITAVASILTGKDEELPFVLLDSDTQGVGLARQLKSNLYQAAQDRVLMTADMCGLEGAEIEDLLPGEFLANVVGRFLRGPDEDFQDVFVEGQPIVPQVEEYAKKHDLALELGWKVEIAKQAKARLLRLKEPLKGQEDMVQKWVALFSRFGGDAN